MVTPARKTCIYASSGIGCSVACIALWRGKWGGQRCSHSANRTICVRQTARLTCLHGTIARPTCSVLVAADVWLRRVILPFDGELLPRLLPHWRKVTCAAENIPAEPNSPFLAAASVCSCILLVVLLLSWITAIVSCPRSSTRGLVFSPEHLRACLGCYCARASYADNLLSFCPLLL